MSDFRSHVDQMIAHSIGRGINSIVIHQKGKPTAEDMVYMASALPKDLKHFELREFKNIYGREISDHMPINLRSLKITGCMYRDNDPSLVNIKLSPMLKSLQVPHTDFSEEASSQMWLSNMPSGLFTLDLEHCVLSRGDAEALASSLSPKLVTLNLDRKEASSDDGLGQEAILSALSESKNILEVKTYINKRNFKDVLAKNEETVLDLMEKMSEDMLTEGDALEALKRLPALGYKMNQKISIYRDYSGHSEKDHYDSMLKFYEKQQNRMIRNLMRAACQCGIAMPEGASSFFNLDDKLQDMARAEEKLSGKETAPSFDPAATIASTKAAGTLVQAIVTGNLEALCAQTRAKGERFNALDFTSSVPVSGDLAMPLVQVIAQRGQLATLCAPENWLGNVAGLSEVLAVVPLRWHEANKVDANALRQQATRLTMQQTRAPGR